MNECLETCHENALPFQIGQNENKVDYAYDSTIAQKNKPSHGNERVLRMRLMQMKITD